jgi:hypothetical protein
MELISKQQIGKQEGYCWKRCFLFRLCKVVIKKTTGVTQLVESWKSSLKEELLTRVWL